MQQQLYKNIFEENSNNLQNAVTQHPYFGLAHYFNLKNKSANELDYETTAQKTALFFDNPYLLQARLNEQPTLAESYDTIDIEPNELVEDKPFIPVENNEFKNNIEVDELVLAETNIDTIQDIIPTNDIVIQNEEIKNSGEFVIENNTTPQQIPTIEFLQDDDAVEESQTVEKLKMEEDIVSNNENIQPIDNNIVHQNIANAENLVSEKPIDVLPVTTEVIENKEEVLFEPLHATDYFASQGIKLSENAFAGDKLGEQLKSFTSWLKTMKKINPEKIGKVDAVVETAVQIQAEKSNVKEAIVTEAMAEAFMLQGKYKQAMEVYEKLSLINPVKNAYFAAKIDNLK